MNTCTLRFISDNKYYEFTAAFARLDRDINQGFIGYKNATGERSGLIEVYHPKQGWAQMVLDDRYPIISNPITLDYAIVAYAIIDTYAQLESMSRSTHNTAPGRSRKQSHLHLVK